MNFDVSPEMMCVWRSKSESHPVYFRPIPQAVCTLSGSQGQYNIGRDYPHKEYTYIKKEIATVMFLLSNLHPYSQRDK